MFFNDAWEVAIEQKPGASVIGAVLTLRAWSNPAVIPTALGTLGSCALTRYRSRAGEATMPGWAPSKRIMLQLIPLLLVQGCILRGLSNRAVTG